jgi:hypothetical protein
VSGRSPSREGTETRTRRLALRLDSFAWEALELESARLGVSEEEIVSYAIAYYLADRDSGRLTREPPPRPPG